MTAAGLAGRAARPVAAQVEGPERLVFTLAAWLGIAKAMLSLASAAVVEVWEFRPLYYLAHVLLFGAAGVILLTLGRSDRRAVALGICFVLIGTAWSDSLLLQLGQRVSALAPAARLLAHTPLTGLAPFFFWSFVRHFPERLRSEPRAAAVQRAVSASLLIGALLVGVNLVQATMAGGELPAFLGVLDRNRRGSLFWPLVMSLTLPAIGFAVHQARFARPDERRRVRILVASLVLGFAPELLVVLGSAVSPAFGRATDPQRVPAMYLVMGGPMMAVPFAVAYAVLVHRALDLRLIVRKVVRYGLARWSIVGVILLPFTIAFVLAYSRRAEPLGQVFQDVPGLLLVLALTAGMLLLRTRPRLYRALDRRFFREQYNAHEILAALVQRGRTLRDIHEIALLVPAEVDRALHVRTVGLFLADHAAARLASPTFASAPLPLGVRLLASLHEAGGVLDVHAESTGGWPADWTLAEQQWLAETDARLLVRISGRSGAFHGVLLLGEKLSELPYSEEDRQLLRTVADAVAMALESVGIEPGSVLPAAAGAEAPAQECTVCGVVSGAGLERCGSCGNELTPAVLPPLLAGKYRAVQRIGRGGMGVVYRAVDELLDREVAVKTLPRATPRMAARMRREARAMAAVTHPNLETIYAVEYREGVPLLVVELLSGGTLADRLRDGPVPGAEALAMASLIAEGLESLHHAGILHRDIKPSNIAFTRDGTPKLLDFGVAHILDVTAPAERRQPPALAHAAPENAAITATGELVGTLLYLSPEAVRGEPPAPAMDLWALSLVAYESIAGRHPFGKGTPLQVLHRIATEGVPDIRSFVPDAAEPLARFFMQCFASDTGVRPRTAREWRRHADAVARSLAAAEPVAQPA